MSPTARKHLLLTVGPEMAQTRSNPEYYGQFLYLLELVANELASQGDALIQVMERSVMDADLVQQYLMDTRMIRNLIRQG